MSIAVSPDERLMRRALRLAALGRHASPNPMVGCVITDIHGEIVGEGHHPEPGQPHAEVFALRAAGARARGGTAHVTLEPCSHHGRTPPCADALIAARLERIVIAMIDPDVRVAGRGIEKLRAAGIGVEIDPCEHEARRLNAAYIKHRTMGIPYGIVKTATTLDGKIATATGDSKWITSATTRRWVHRQLRDRCDAILIGVGTVVSDDPSLTTRLTHKPGRNPLRIILDSHLRTSSAASVVCQAAHDKRTLIVHLPSPDPTRIRILRDLGVDLWECEPDDKQQVDLASLFQYLGTRGDILSVLMEGGSSVAASALTAGVVDRYIATIAPKIIGGQDAPGPVGGPGIARAMRDATMLRQCRMRRSGTDFVIDGYFNERERKDGSNDVYRTD